MTVHFIYALGESIATPYCITHEVSKRLRLKYDVAVYDWCECRRITPMPGDILIGHPSPVAGTIFRESFLERGWSKRIILSPFAHGRAYQYAFLDPMVMEADAYLAICGPYWTKTIGESLVAHWAQKMTRVDLAINRDHFPPIKTKFNSKGSRKILTITSTEWVKGADYFSRLSECNPEIEFGWIGGGSMASTRVVRHGKKDFRDAAALELVREYDFLLHCGRSDANPTTILEAAAWGLIPVCTQQSGYCDVPWIINIPLDNEKEASTILRKLNHLDEDELLRLQAHASDQIKQHYNWDRFVVQIEAAMRSENEANKKFTMQLSAKDLANRKKLARVQAILDLKMQANLCKAKIRGQLSRLKQKILAKKKL